jgi:hypothetical protein
MPRRIPDYPDAYGFLNQVSSFGSILTVFGLIVFIFNDLIRGFRRPVLNMSLRATIFFSRPTFFADMKEIIENAYLARYSKYPDTRTRPRHLLRYKRQMFQIEQGRDLYLAYHNPEEINYYDYHNRTGYLKWLTPTVEETEEDTARILNIDTTGEPYHDTAMKGMLDALDNRRKVKPNLGEEVKLETRSRLPEFPSDDGLVIDRTRS